MLAGEFDEPEDVLVRFIVGLPGWAILEFESVEWMFREMTRKHAPLLEVVRRYKVRFHDERGCLEFDYRHWRLFEGLHIQADGQGKG